MMNGLVLKPDFALGIQCFVDADFVGMWDKEDCMDPSSVYSHTGYVIMYAGCPILHMGIKTSNRGCIEHYRSRVPVHSSVTSNAQLNSINEFGE